jgi:hydrogenase maturation protease
MAEPDGRAGRVLLIGVGNRDRGDDAVGPVVCDLVRERGLDGIDVLVFEGSVVDLPLHWGPTDRVTIVDAAAPGGRPGRVTVVDALAQPLTAPTSVSTHSIDVATAVGLARALDRLPAELTIIGIEGTAFDVDAALSVDVVRAAGRVVARLTAPQPACRSRS